MTGAISPPRLSLAVVVVRGVENFLRRTEGGTVSLRFYLG